MVIKNGTTRRCTWCTLCTLCTLACSYTPAGRERAHVYEMLRAIPEVTQTSVGCEGAIFASDSLCADVITKEGALRFERVGAKSFGSSAVNVVVAEASGLVPRVASCTDVGPANFHHEAALGHHFSPTLIDIKDAVTRSGDVLEEIQVLAALSNVLGSAGQARRQLSLLRTQERCAGGSAQAVQLRRPVARGTKRRAGLKSRPYVPLSSRAKSLGNVVGPWCGQQLAVGQHIHAVIALGINGANHLAAPSIEFDQPSWHRVGTSRDTR